MATIDDFSNIKISTSDLLVFQRELIQEKELLQNILTKIDDQISRLQVNIIFTIPFLSVLILKNISYDKMFRWSNFIYWD